jgi:predicted ribosome quality control (RQC) complex YloA/Tae2 family protein
MRLDEELDRLYGLPLAEFTRARNELARELLGAGEREAADDVKVLRKPSISAWTVNQLARKERLQVRSLMTAAERLRDAQARLLRGGSRDELQEAVQRHREVVGALLDSAKQVLRSAGHPATEATLERIRETLTAVAGHDEGMRLVEEGRLSEDLDPAGFGPVTLGAGAGRKPSPPVRQREKSARKKRIDEAKQEVDRLRAELAERKARARQATSEAKRAKRAAEAAKEAAEKEEAELGRLTERLEAAKDALERSRSA